MAIDNFSLYNESYIQDKISIRIGTNFGEELIIYSVEIIYSNYDNGEYNLELIENAISVLKE